MPFVKSTTLRGHRELIRIALIGGASVLFLGWVGFVAIRFISGPTRLQREYTKVALPPTFKKYGQHYTRGSADQAGKWTYSYHIDSTRRSAYDALNAALVDHDYHFTDTTSSADTRSALGYMTAKNSKQRVLITIRFPQPAGTSVVNEIGPSGHIRTVSIDAEYY